MLSLLKEHISVNMHLSRSLDIMMKALAVLLVLAMKQLNQAKGSPKMFLVYTKGGRTETSQTQKGGVFLFDVVVAEVPVTQEAAVLKYR